MSIYKEFLGLNYCIYEPILDDEGAAGENVVGYSFASPLKYSDGIGSNPNISNFTSHDASKTMVLLNLHRNGPFGYPTWKQIRVSDNHLTRAQRRLNLFSYTEEPGPVINSKNSRFGETRVFKEPVVVDSYKPISLVGEIKVYNDKLNIYQARAVEIKTSFGNETAFFANKEINENYDLIQETCEEYEQLKDLYLDGGLEDEGSPIDSFNLLVYRQSIFPRTEYSFLEETRTRKYFQNLFWRSDREDRHQENVDGGFGLIIAEKSMWPLDDRKDFDTRTEPSKQIMSITNNTRFDFDIGGLVFDNVEQGPGILQNRFSSYVKGYYQFSDYFKPIRTNNVTPPPPIAISMDNYLTSSCEYSLLHTLKNIYSPVNPSGIEILRSHFTVREDATNHFYSMPTSSIFNGTANWDAVKQSGKEPFYDSYEDFSTDIKIKGKSFTKIPEFKISSHVEFYNKNSIIDENLDLFELSGSSKTSPDSISKSGDQDFYKILSNSDFLKHFDLVKKDNKDLSSEKIISLKCKAIKKFLPMKGFYPADRCSDISTQFYKSYKDKIKFTIEDTSLAAQPFINTDQFATKPLFTPMISPGILFNTIKSGVAVDFPIFFKEEIQYERDSSLPSGDEDIATFDFLDDFGRNGIERGDTDYGTVDGVGSANKCGDLNNALIFNTNRTKPYGQFYSIFSKRIPFEALVEPEKYLANEKLVIQDPHPFAFSREGFVSNWNGEGDPFFRKMISNFLAEVPEMFLQDNNMRNISSLEEQNPEFGNAISGSYYVMRLKMTKSRNKPNQAIQGIDGRLVQPPQDVVDQGNNFSINEKFSVRETITMYSRPSAFGFPTAGDGGLKQWGGVTMRLGSTWGYNFPYTPPYYHGEAWCDLIFRPSETRKYSVDEILSEVKSYPYYSRYWNVYFNDALRDLTGYKIDDFGNVANVPTTYTEAEFQSYFSGSYSGYEKSPWSHLIHSESLSSKVGGHSWVPSYTSPSWPSTPSSGETLSWASPLLPAANEQERYWKYCGPQSPLQVNNNAMQLNSSVNIFGKGTIKKITSDNSTNQIEVASGDTVRGKTRWIIQPKFETPILNFNKYSNIDADGCTPPQFAKSQVPRGMWHQYGDLPKDDEGIYLKVDDIPEDWLRGALRIPKGNKKIKSLADLVGFSKDPVRLGEVADVKEISEAVVAVPFIEKDGTRQFFSIPREDIDSCIEASKREAAPGEFVAGGPPKAGDSVYQMVKKMKKYVFPPSMDFVKYKEIDPFAMYVFEFKHNLTKQDLADIWQNLPPDIGTRMEEAEATISHELLAHELLGGGSVVKNGVLDDNAEGNGIPSNIQWMIFKAKKRAKTNYFDKVVAKKGTTEDTSDQQLENAQGQTGDDKGITYNWPYDYFSLVELVKLDAEVTFANIENDDKGQKSIKKVERKNPLQQAQSRAEARGMNIARGKGKAKK